MMIPFFITRRCGGLRKSPKDLRQVLNRRIEALRLTPGGFSFGPRFPPGWNLVLHRVSENLLFQPIVRSLFGDDHVMDVAFSQS